MTINDLVERAKRLLNAGQPQPHTWPESEIDIAASVKLAIAVLARQVMEDSAIRSLLQQTYSVALDVSGVGDPLTATGSITGLAGEILTDGIRYGVVVDNDSNILKPIKNYADFLAPQLRVYGYYCLKDRKVLTRAKDVTVNGPTDIQPVNGPLSITANFEPQAVDTVPNELEDELVQILCRIVALKTNADTQSVRQPRS